MRVAPRVTVLQLITWLQLLLIRQRHPMLPLHLPWLQSDTQLRPYDLNSRDVRLGSLTKRHRLIKIIVILLSIPKARVIFNRLLYHILTYIQVRSSWKRNNFDKNVRLYGYAANLQIKRPVNRKYRIIKLPFLFHSPWGIQMCSKVEFRSWKFTTQQWDSIQLLDWRVDAFVGDYVRPNAGQF